MTTPTVGTSWNRRYLLGQLGDEETERFEQDYLRSPEMLADLTAEEDLLVEQYLEGELVEDERERFERVYLSSPAGQRRVDVVSRLRVAAAQRQRASVAGPRPSRAAGRSVTFAIAASVAATVGAFTWWANRPHISDEPVSVVTTPPLEAGQIPSPLAVPVYAAVTLSPIATRSEAGPAPLTMSANVDMVRIELRVTARLAEPVRASIATVTGGAVWEGSPAAAQPDAVYLELPADMLPPDDYLVTLIGRDAGVEHELHRYFLRVRGQ
jgi:hypothetical protein